MKKNAFLVLLCLTACNSNQKPTNTLRSSKKDELMFPFRDTTFNWEKIEKQNDSLKVEFTKVAATLLKYEFATYNQNDEYSKPRLNEFKNGLHVIDFNGDGKDDLIFDGESGGEPKEIAFILNLGKEFKVIFKEEQQVKKITFDNRKITKLYIEDPGCCAAHMTFDKIYNLNYQSAIPQFTRLYFTGHHHYTYFPKAYFNQQVKFEVLNNKYKIRTKPMIDDTCKTFISGEPLKGDAIGELNKGSVGRAIAAETDKTGRVWWLVEMAPNSKIKTTVFYDDNDADKASKMGWISSRYVKVLDR